MEWNRSNIFYNLSQYVPIRKLQFALHDISVVSSFIVIFLKTTLMIFKNVIDFSEKISFVLNHEKKLYR